MSYPVTERRCNASIFYKTIITMNEIRNISVVIADFACRINAIRDEALSLIRGAVAEHKVIGTFYKNLGEHYSHEQEPEEYDSSPIVVIHNTNFGAYGGYEAATVYDLFFDERKRLLCTLNGEACEDFDEPLEHIQTEGLLCIVEWLVEYDFITNDMKTQILTTYFFGHKVEVTLDMPDERDELYPFVPASVTDDFVERIECGARSGTFENLPDNELNTVSRGFFLSGSWCIVEIDYEKISRVLAWDYNRMQEESLTEELFIRHFGGVMGRHYYEKWSRVYAHDLRRMLAYFGYNLREGQRFCDMVAEQVRKYEQCQKQEKR